MAKASVLSLVFLGTFLTPAARAEAIPSSLVATHAELSSQNERILAKKKMVWRISAAVLGAVTIADVQSSWGRREANPILRGADGRFGSPGVALKAGLVGATIGAQYLVLRKRPQAAGWAAVANFAAAGATGAVAARNHTVK